jgi:hypothetical protein
VTFLSQLKSTLLYSLVGDHRSEGRSFARKTRVRKITHEKVRTLDLAPLSIAIYRHVVSNVLEKAYTHTLPLDVGFASDV